MVKQELHIRRYDWHVLMYFDYTCRFCDEVIDEMEEIGCGDANMEVAYGNLSSCEMNTGITFSDYGSRSSVVVISRTTSSKEFLKTYHHELGHLSKHIAKYHGIDLDGEEIEYLGQDVVDDTWEIAKLYLCDCDCCKNKINKLNKHYVSEFKN